MSIFIVKIYV